MSARNPKIRPSRCVAQQRSNNRYSDDADTPVSRVISAIVILGESTKYRTAASRRLYNSLSCLVRLASSTIGQMAQSFSSSGMDPRWNLRDPKANSFTFGSPRSLRQSAQIRFEVRRLCLHTSEETALFALGQGLPPVAGSEFP